jgi:hypothetical protein
MRLQKRYTSRNTLSFGCSVSYISFLQCFAECYCFIRLRWTSALIRHWVMRAAKWPNAHCTPPPTAAFAVTITSCVARGGKDQYHVYDGAAVLSYSIHQNSIRGSNGGKYDYALYAFHHPDAASCAKP